MGLVGRGGGVASSGLPLGGQGDEMRLKINHGARMAAAFAGRRGTGCDGYDEVATMDEGL